MLKKIIILSFWISSACATLSLESIGGVTHTFPNQNQLLFIGSSKKSHQQIEGWFQALKKHPELVKKYQISVVPLVDGLFSSFLFRKGFLALLNKKIPERHRHLVVPVFKGDREYPFFNALKSTKNDELQIVLFNHSKALVFQETGNVSDDKLKVLQQL